MVAVSATSTAPFIFSANQCTLLLRLNCQHHIPEQVDQNPKRKILKRKKEDLVNILEKFNTTTKGP